MASSFPIFGLSAARQMRGRGETSHDEAQYNLLIALWLFGFVPLGALEYSEKADASLGALWIAAYPVAAFLIWRYRVELRRSSKDRAMVQKRTGLRVLVLGVGILTVLFLLNDALLEVLPYTGFVDLRDLIVWRWIHALAALAALGGGYLYLSARTRQ